MVWQHLQHPTTQCCCMLETKGEMAAVGNDQPGVTPRLSCGMEFRRGCGQVLQKGRWHRSRPPTSQAQLHEAMAPDVRRVLQGKNLLVSKEILFEAQVPHAVELVAYVAAGFPCCWTHAATGSLSAQESRGASPRHRSLVGRCPCCAEVLPTSSPMLRRSWLGPGAP